MRDDGKPCVDSSCLRDALQYIRNAFVRQMTFTTLIAVSTARDGKLSSTWMAL